MSPVWHLALALRTSEMLVRPGWEPVWGGVAARFGAHVVLPTGFEVEGAIVAGVHPDAAEVWAGSVHLFQPVGRAEIGLHAIYGWEYSALADGSLPLGKLYFGTVYGLGVRAPLSPRIELRPALLVRSDLHVDGGPCLTDLACAGRSLWEEGRLDFLVQWSLLRRVTPLPRAE